MSSRRQQRSMRHSNTARISDDEIFDLLSKLRDLLPEARTRSDQRVPAAMDVLQETCNHIRSLHREVDDLSQRLSGLLDTTETSSAQAAIIRSLFSQ